MMKQDSIFYNGEGDRWFRRNKIALDKPDRIKNDIPLKILEQNKFEIQPKKILEIGCSHGWRLEELRNRWDAQCTGVDPSEEALQEGASKYPQIKFLRGLVSQLPIIESEQFDLVIVNFVFHWISRASLLQSLAEADRVVKDGGYLLIGDFYPDAPTLRPYHHLPNESVYTFKQDYSLVFTASNLYQVVNQAEFDHDSNIIRDDSRPENRGRCTLLKKSLNSFYKQVK